jgi:hypothetical protein
VKCRAEMHVYCCVPYGVLLYHPAPLSHERRVDCVRKGTAAGLAGNNYCSQQSLTLQNHRSDYVEISLLPFSTAHLDLSD